MTSLFYPLIWTGVDWFWGIGCFGRTNETRWGSLASQWCVGNHGEFDPLYYRIKSYSASSYIRRKDGVKQVSSNTYIR